MSNQSNQTEETPYVGEKIQVIKLEKPILLLTHFTNKGYLFYQLAQESKDAICNHEQLPEHLRTPVIEFLSQHGHTTLVGNFGKVNKKSYEGMGAVKGTLKHFPQLKKGLAVNLEMTHLAILDGSDVVCGRVQPAKDQDFEDPVILREQLPQDVGLAPEIYQGISHVTLHVDTSKGFKPVNSNDVLLTVKDQFE